MFRISRSSGWRRPEGQSKPGDPVIRFDPSSARQQLDEKNAALHQAQATLDQAVAQARITAEQDKLDLATARYDVERAKLEASKQAIVSVIQGEESKIDLAIGRTEAAGAGGHREPAPEVRRGQDRLADPAAR